MDEPAFHFIGSLLASYILKEAPFRPFRRSSSSCLKILIWRMEPVPPASAFTLKDFLETARCPEVSNSLLIVSLPSAPGVPEGREL